MERQRQYIAIDLKSFYASVECVERGLDPLDVCLVVADGSRTDKTICLAVSPALKAFGTGGRPRLFEVIQKIKEINKSRGNQGFSRSGHRLASHPELKVDYYVATPRMALYIDYSTRIFDVYLRYVAPEDMHVYSIDEVFIDATSYLSMYRMTAHELAIKMIREVLAETGVTATAGIGTNLYLAKIAMDIVAKKMPPDKDGVRIAELDEASYRKLLWSHTPLTDFWRVGPGVARRLSPYGLYTMGDIARCSLHHEDLLYKLFGINAELLIDHAWGWEPVTIDYIKSYRPAARSISTGQVLTAPYPVAHARNVILEMADAVALELTEKNLLVKQIVVDIGYDVASLATSEKAAKFKGKLHTDHYGRKVPEHSHGTYNFPAPTSSSSALVAGVAALFDRIVNTDLLVRRLNISLCHLTPALQPANEVITQLELFTDYEEQQRIKREKAELSAREQRRQKAMVKIKKIYGKNAILKGLNYSEGATQRERNSQIGGHKA